MAGAFSSVKITSSTIVLRLEADDRFLEYLKNTVKKSFSTAMIMRHSIFIFSRENERHRRKVFLTWAANLLSKELSSNKKNLFDTMFHSCDLPINIQIASKTSMVGVKKAYAYFSGGILSIKCYGKEAPLFSYIRAALRGRCEIDQTLYELKISSLDKSAILYVKSIFSKKLLLGMESYEIVYSKPEFERFVSEISAFGSSHVDTAAMERTKMMSLLGLSGMLTPENIKKRYFELAKKYHPDLHTDKSEQERASLSMKFLQIKEAYEALR
ncbi:MAG: J domain-containing protein [Campylobacterales bacterium]